MWIWFDPTLLHAELYVFNVAARPGKRRAPLLSLSLRCLQCCLCVAISRSGQPAPPVKWQPKWLALVYESKICWTVGQICCGRQAESSEERLMLKFQHRWPSKANQNATRSLNYSQPLQDVVLHTSVWELRGQSIKRQSDGTFITGSASSCSGPFIATSNSGGLAHPPIPMCFCVYL